ncbi:putative cyclin-D6-1 [Cornus florida]|uniref:putative cyclin-D6-1 n=1 Tax=Cornus florida TaxID=4283 RepID=UPI00289864E2|nr:putative cyclin-D6-1 [Cornus florida]
MEFDLENPLTSLEEHQIDTVPSLFANESDLMPSPTFNAGDFRVSVRRQAISLISQAQFSCNFDDYISYLAINYIDRFISKQEIPQGKPWISKLLVISCLSLAAKMKNTDLSLSDLQREEGFIFDAQSIHRMELLILARLNWRMRSITPFSFLHYFLSFFELEDPPLIQALKDRASDIIFISHNEIKLLEYKPSLIAASALLCASHELFPSQYMCSRTAISSLDYVNQEKLVKCLSVIEESVMVGYEYALEAVSSTTKTPISVLGHHCTTSESENTTTGHNLTADRDNIKRRKLNGFCSEHAFQLSQTQQC